MTTALQAMCACNELTSHNLGSVVEACNSAAPFLVGRLRDPDLVGEHTLILHSCHKFPAVHMTPEAGQCRSCMLVSSPLTSSSSCLCIYKYAWRR